MNEHEFDFAAADHPAAACAEESGRCKMCAEMKTMRVVRSDELLQGHRELLIVHAGQVYRLLRTRKDKLILQK